MTYDVRKVEVLGRGIVDRVCHPADKLVRLSHSFNQCSIDGEIFLGEVLRDSPSAYPYIRCIYM